MLGTKRGGHLTRPQLEILAAILRRQQIRRDSLVAVMGDRRDGDPRKRVIVFHTQKHHLQKWLTKNAGVTIRVKDQRGYGGSEYALSPEDKIKVREALAKHMPWEPAI